MARKKSQGPTLLFTGVYAGMNHAIVTNTPKLKKGEITPSQSLGQGRQRKTEQHLRISGFSRLKLVGEIEPGMLLHEDAMRVDPYDVYALSVPLHDKESPWNGLVSVMFGSLMRTRK